MSDQSQGPGWWQASDGKWYPPETAPGQPAPPQSAQPVYVVQQQQGNGMAVAALVTGIIGTILGLIPLFFILAWILGVLALVFGLVGRKKGKPRRKMATIGAILGVIAIALGVLGVAIVNDAFEDLDDCLDSIGTATQDENCDS